MKRLIYVLFLGGILLGGCSTRNAMMRQLDEIGDLLEQRQNDSALALLARIEPESLGSEEEKANYWLYRIQAEYRLYLPIKTAETLKQCEQYFKAIGDTKKLVQTYYYWGSIDADLGKNKEAIQLLKKGEHQAEKHEDLVDWYHLILQSLSVTNGKNNENEMAMAYDLKALRTAYKTGNKEWIVTSQMNLSLSYYRSGNLDSAIHYVERCVPYADSLPDLSRAALYCNIGMLYMELNRPEAERYLAKSIKIDGNAYSCKLLADIYIKRGERARADSLWQSALRTENLYLKANVLKAMQKAMAEEGRLEEANRIMNQLLELKDTIAQQRKEEDLKGEQQRFELQMKEERMRRNMDYAVGGSIILALLVATGIFYGWWRREKYKNEASEREATLNRLKKELATKEQMGEASGKEIERLNRKIAAHQAKQNAMLAKGRERFEEIEQGGTTVRWGKDDFADCLEFFAVQDLAFMNHLNTDYRSLSVKHKFFAILQHLNKPDEEIERIMGISPTTVRVIRSRIKKQQIEEEY